MKNDIYNKQPAARIHYLDSIRGIAAMMVVVYHFIGWHGEGDQRFHIASLIFNGSDAVSFFFVLSGFALSYKYLNRGAEVNLVPYTFKRILRLYPAYIIVVLANYWYMKSGWSFSQIAKDIFWLNDSNIWEELTMVRNNHKYYTPGWTLGVEMALSMVMPLLVIVAKHRISVIWWFVPIVIFIGPYYMSSFTVHFCLGLLISYYYQDLVDFDLKKSKWYSHRYWLIFIVLIAFSIRHIVRMLPFAPETEYANNLLKVDYFLSTGIASAAIILFVILTPKIQKRLQKPIFLFIGKISYSIYLVHWLIVSHIMKNKDHYFGYFNHEVLAFFTLLTIAILLTILISTILYHLVEAPSIRLGRKWANDWKARKESTSH